MTTQARLKELFDYDPSGALVKKARRRGNIVGVAAGSKSTTYINVMVDGRRYLLHRLVFLFHNGHTPQQVDHVNGDPNDNRIENLRAATAAENARNRKIRANSGTGVKNVHYDRRKRKYVVRLKVDGKNRRFGMYAALEDAATVARVLRERHHGEFARG